VTIPDYISPIVAYRVWQWDAIGLKSLNNEHWFPGLALEASTARCGNEHVAPSDGCRCGIYAAKNFQHLVEIGYAGYGVHGEVYLWGTVVEHRFGWRAQFAYPRTLVLPPDAIPFKMSQAESRLETLMAYGVDIAIATAAPIPLWSKRSGYDQVGLDLLIEKRKRWYSYREQERRLKAGDRVAVRGQGIGVVSSADADGVCVLMWNKLSLGISRKKVVWSRQNWRWEADAAGTFARTTPPAHATGRATMTTI
jgi:hypothetical protein